MRRRALLLGLVALAFGAGFVRSSRRPVPARFRVAERPAPGRAARSGGEPHLETRFVSRRHGVERPRRLARGARRRAAAGVLVHRQPRGRARRAGRVRGLRSGAGRVGRGAGGGRARRDAARAVRRVAKVGNPAVVRGADGTLWLFYVTVTVGGWGGSTVSLVRSTDDGETWEPARRLIGSPFLNLNTMVRGAPFLYEDGTIGLPAYQSLVRGFSEILRIDAGGGRRRQAAPQHARPGLAARRPPDRPRSGARADARLGTAAGRSDGEPHAGRRPALDSAVADRAAQPRLGRGGPRPAGRAGARGAERRRRGARRAEPGRLGRGGRGLADSSRGSRTRPRRGRCRWTTSVTGARSRPWPGTPTRARRMVRRYVASSRRFMCWEPRCHFEFSYPFLLRAADGEYPPRLHVEPRLHQARPVRPGVARRAARGRPPAGR